mgnify:CR=1 FL=1
MRVVVIPRVITRSRFNRADISSEKTKLFLLFAIGLLHEYLHLAREYVTLKINQAYEKLLAIPILI